MYRPFFFQGRKVPRAILFTRDQRLPGLDILTKAGTPAGRLEDPELQRALDISDWMVASSSNDADLRQCRDDSGTRSRGQDSMTGMC